MGYVNRVPVRDMVVGTGCSRTLVQASLVPPHHCFRAGLSGPTTPLFSFMCGNGAFVNTSWDRSTRHGIAQYVMGSLNTSSRAYKTKRAGWQRYWREHFCGTSGIWRNIWPLLRLNKNGSFPVQFAFFSEPWKMRRPLQLSLTSTQCCPWRRCLRMLPARAVTPTRKALFRDRTPFGKALFVKRSQRLGQYTKCGELPILSSLSRLTDAHLGQPGAPWTNWWPSTL